MHGLDVALLGGAAVPDAGASRIGLHAETPLIERPQPILGLREALVGGTRVPFDGVLEALIGALALGQTRANLDAMLAELRKRDIPVLLTGMMASPNMGSDYAKKFNPIYPELAGKYDVSFYPFILDNVVTDKALMLADNLHPNAKGVTVVAEALAPLVEQALPNAG